MGIETKVISDQTKGVLWIFGLTTPAFILVSYVSGLEIGINRGTETERQRVLDAIYQRRNNYSELERQNPTLLELENLKRYITSGETKGEKQ